VSVQSPWSASTDASQATGPDGWQADRPVTRNRLLSALCPADAGLLRPFLEPVALPVHTRLAAADTPIEHAYFIEEGIASIVAANPRGERVEIAIVGREGMSGVALLQGTDRAPYEIFVQTPGQGSRIKAADLRSAVQVSPSLNEHLLRYAQALMIQIGYTALANGCHVLEQRLARWLVMCHDRVNGDELSTTHEFLSIMLGVRRAGVSEALQSLEDRALISTGRGRVTVLDRARLEHAAGGSYGVPEAEYARLIGQPLR
jgi:CRP-like cAMP-binding protein